MYLGIDTSNYTTSVALFDGENMVQKKRLLAVKTGERGLRQSDALFQHTVNLPQLIEKIDFSGKLNAVAVSENPRCVEGSYMPCFLAGVSAACAVSKFADVPLYRTSHQTGHILAALYSAGKLDLINRDFIAFHVSGGTTEALYIKPDKENIIKADIVAQSNDLKAGQAIDRAGVMMGIDFPCGKELDRLSLLSDKEFKIKPSMSGADCSLSGVENKAKKMFADGQAKEDISKFVLTYIFESLSAMTEEIFKTCGEKPLIFAGGVMSNTLIKSKLKERYNPYFAEPEFSCDNAAGIAVYAYLKENNL
ncbi:MAG: peptidase M22 [Eubacteriales bacterium]|nr:peptidase M22 [Eubacteriales bacterium]